MTMHGVMLSLESTGRNGALMVRQVAKTMALVAVVVFGAYGGENVEAIWIGDAAAIGSYVTVYGREVGRLNVASGTAREAGGPDRP
jgi:hypothetical protein